MKRILVPLFAVGAALLLGGCPGPAPPAATPPPTVPSQGGETDELSGELTLYTIWNAEPRKSALTDIVEGFEKENPDVEVTVSHLEPDVYKTKIRVLLGGDDPPDIYFVWSGEKMLHNFVRGGNCLDLTDYLDADGAKWRSRMVPASLAPYIYDGRTYGIPYLLQCTFMFYNKDIFEAHGIGIPQTWMGLVAVCEQLKEAGVTPIALGNVERWPAHHFPCVLFQRLMGHETVAAQYAPLGPGDYSDPGWSQGLQMFDEFQKAGYFNPSPNGLSRADARVMFYTERAAMFYTGTWDFAQFTEKGKAPSGFWGKWDFFNFPSVAGGAGDQTALAGSADGYVISSKTKHPQAAVAFLKYMTSLPVATQFVDQCKELVQVQGAVGDQNENWYLRRYAEMVEEAAVISAWTDTLMERSVAEALMNGVQGLLSGQKTPEEILADVRERQGQVNEELLALEEAGG